MTKCSDFHRDKKVQWIEYLSDRCNVCMYRDNDDKCKLHGINNSNALCHSYHYSNNSRVSMVLR